MPARGGRSCECFGGYKTINRIPLPLYIRSDLSLKPMHLQASSGIRELVKKGWACLAIQGDREIHPLDPQPHRYCMLASTASAPRVTRCSLGLYWSRDLCSKHADWLAGGCHPI